MNIRTQITIAFSLIVGLILLIFSIVIFIFSSDYREEQFYSRLKEKSLTTAKLLFEVEEVDSVLMELIDRADQTLLFKEKVVIYDQEGKKIYDSKADLPALLTKENLDEIRTSREQRFEVDDHEILGMVFYEKNEKYVVVASAYDKFGYSKIQNLAQILLVCLFISVSLLITTGRLFAKKLLTPISNIIKQTGIINAANLGIRVSGGTGKDEIAQLAHAFNKMLEGLEAAFDIQRDFVSHASHELRTPLTSISGQIEVALMKDRTHQEYVNVLNSIREDMDNFVDLTNKLLLLAQTNTKLPVLPAERFRVDEVLWQARTEILKRKPYYTINIEFPQEMDDETMLITEGSQQLLRVAFINLMDNACKFSSDHCATIQVKLQGDDLLLVFLNEGPPIEASEAELIFTPFYRANNSSGISGHGIGLSLVKNIVVMHNGTIKVSSLENGLTAFSLILSPLHTAEIAA